MASFNLENERYKMWSAYWRDKVRGDVPRVSLPGPSTNPLFDPTAPDPTPEATSNPTQPPTEERVDCSSCSKPCEGHCLPGRYVSILLPCLHNFCTRCSIFKLSASNTCIMPDCGGAIPPHTKQLLTTQHRCWAVQEAVGCCNDSEYTPLAWHGLLKDIVPIYDTAADFLVNKASTTPTPKTGSLAYIDIAAFRPHLVGFANLLPTMRHAEGEAYDGDRKRQWRYIVRAIDEFLAGQIYRTVPAKLLPDCAHVHVDKWLKQHGGSLGWSASGEHEDDFALMVDFVVDACQNDYYNNHSWRRKSAGMYKRVVGKVRGS